MVKRNDATLIFVFVFHDIDEGKGVDPIYRRTSQGALVSPDDGSIASLSLTEMLLLLLLCGALGSRNDLLGRTFSELCHVTIPEYEYSFPYT